MTDLRIIPWIRGHDEGDAVALARALIHAEARRLGLPLSDFSMSGRVKARDQGVDGRTHFPDGCGSLLPTGPQVWQVKSGASVPSATAEFDPKHVGLIDAIRKGYDYVLFWTNDPADPNETNVREAFTAAVQAIRPDAKAEFIFADRIERLCYAHLAVLAQSPALPLAGVVSLRTWGSRQDFTIPFQTDGDRTRYIEALRAHASTENASAASIHVFGDTGVGKSRLVYEALCADGLEQRVLVAPDPAHLDRSLLSLVAESAERRLILVVDNCTYQDRQAISQFADFAQGRIRLVTVGSRYNRDPQAPDARYLELLPLATSASLQIALSVGIAETDAEFVAQYTEGYPKLAFVLAEAVAHGGPTTGLLDRVRNESVGGVLSSMLTNPDDALLLGALSLFEQLGFDDELAIETTIACHALGIEEDAFRDVVDRDLNRFVSRAGRYRLVTPRLFAVWLASQFIRQRPVLGEALQSLPESLRERITTQMTAFAGDRHVARALQQLFEQPPFTTGALGDVDEGSARLIHVAAIVDPNLAMRVIEAALGDRSVDELRDSLTEGRRGFVEALEVLVWLEPTFERAAWALLRLALAENETWANNATGVLQGIFRVNLGGTAVSYERRLAWCRSALNQLPQAALILVGGLAYALDIQEMRGVPGFASRTAPPEWRPKNIAEEISARRSAWQLLVELARDGRELSEIADVLAGGLRAAVARGLVEDVLSDLPSIAWPPSARARFGEALDQLLRYDDLPGDIAARIRPLRTTLVGTGLADRLPYLLSTPAWNLRDDEAPDKLSPLVSEVAAELVAGGSPAIVEAAHQSRRGDHQTAGLLFEQVAQTTSDEGLLHALEAERPLPEAALLGLFVGLANTRDPSWRIDTLRRWLQSDLGRLVIQAAHMLTPSEDLAALAIQAVRDGHSAPGELGRLLYGAWARALPASQIVDIAAILRQTGGTAEIERALGVISLWLDGHPDHHEPALNRITIDLVNATSQISSRSSPMLALYRERVLTRLGISLDDQLQLLINVLGHLNTFPGPHDLNIVDALARKDPPRTIEAVLSVILGEEEPVFRLNVKWLEHARVLSRLARATSAEEVARHIERVPQERWRELVAHVDFSISEPDPLIETLVIKSTDDVTCARAAFSFIYPEMMWWGPESNYLRARRSVAVTWLDTATIPEMRQWLREIIEEIDSRITRAERDEAETGD